MKNFLKANWPILSILGLSVFILWPLFLPGYFFHHDDLHIMRIFEMRKCFADLQIPCRWVPDMGWGNGFPLFNYYSALPYYIGAILSYPLTYVDSAKALFFIPLILGGISMFLLCRYLFGKIPGLVGAILYLFAPYRAVDSYTRGAVAESFSLALIPIVFYFGIRLIKKKSVFAFVGLSLSLAAFLITHNLMTMMFLPVFLVWIFYWIWQEKFRDYIKLLLSLSLGFGLSAFFTIPVFFEKNLVQSENLISGGFQYWIHYVTLFQLFFDRKWGFGFSIFGTGDTLSFQIGWPHWWIVLIFVGILSLRLFRRKTLDRNLFFGILILLTFLFSIFMTHNKSTLLWQLIPALQYLQFPWRYLGLTIFSLSVLGGLVVTLIDKKFRSVFTILVVLLTIFLNWSFFRPADFYLKVTDKTKLTGSDFEYQQKASIKDYLPITAKEPTSPASSEPEVRSGKAKVLDYHGKSNSFEFKSEVLVSANLEIPIYDFPIWKIWVNGEEFPHSNKNTLGRIRVDLPPGEYFIQGKFTNTPVRTIANALTLISLILLIYFLTPYAKLKFKS